MEIIRIKNGSIYRTDFENIYKLTYDISNDNLIAFKLCTKEYVGELSRGYHLEALHSIFSNLIKYIKQTKRENFNKQYEGDRIIIERDTSLDFLLDYKIPNFIKDAYGKMREEDNTEDFENKAVFKAKENPYHDGFYRYEIIIDLEKLKITNNEFNRAKDIREEEILNKFLKLEETGKYLFVAREPEYHEYILIPNIQDYAHWSDLTAINKKDADVLEAYLKNENVELEWYVSHNGHPYIWDDYFPDNFIEEYDEQKQYRLKQAQQQKK